MNEQLKTQVLEQLKTANNVLVAVSNNPTVDELSASIALTLILNKMNKHATTVFSGEVPSTLEFLQPEKTIEKNTDSLRDFIIALDKSKADKLRYKVEDDVVRIFITPYRTSITDKDLQFSQGDFNVDVVLALGVTKREDLDRAITAHGRILHDATIVSLTTRDSVSELGSMNWQEPQASSLCEMVSVLSLELDRQAIDGQMATALMTGIIAETDRFRNDRTTPLALSLSSQLMSAGANQQLIAEKLEPKPEPKLDSAPMAAPEAIPEMPKSLTMESIPADADTATKNNGELEIEHTEDENGVEKITIDEHGNLSPFDVPPIEQKDTYAAGDTPAAPENGNTETLELSEPDSKPAKDEHKELETITNSTEQEDKAAVPAVDQAIPTMTHGKTIAPPLHGGELPKSDKPFDLNEALKNEIAKEEGTPIIPSPEVETKDESLVALEKAVDSPHISTAGDASAEKVDDMRDVVAKAADAVVSPFPSPSKSLGGQPVDMQPITPIAETPTPQVTPAVVDPNAAPPVPPPMPLTPQFYDSDGKNQDPLGK